MSYTLKEFLLDRSVEQKKDKDLQILRDLCDRATIKLKIHNLMAERNDTLDISENQNMTISINALKQEIDNYTRKNLHLSLDSDVSESPTEIVVAEEPKLKDYNILNYMDL